MAILMTTELAAMQRRLDAWELQHLRAHAAELAERLEAAERELEDTKRTLAWSDDCAQMWRDHAMNLEASLDDEGSQADRHVGLTASGHLLVVSKNHMTGELSARATIGRAHA